MIYREPLNISHDDAEYLFVHGSPHQITDALVGLALYDPDVYWVEAKCLSYIAHVDPQIRAVAAICLGH